MKKYSILLISLMLLSGCQKETFISNLDTINNILYNFKEELYKIEEYEYSSISKLNNKEFIEDIVFSEDEKFFYSNSGLNDENNGVYYFVDGDYYYELNENDLEGKKYKVNSGGITKWLETYELGRSILDVLYSSEITLLESLKSIYEVHDNIEGIEVNATSRDSITFSADNYVSKEGTYSFKVVIKDYLLTCLEYSLNSDEISVNINYEAKVTLPDVNEYTFKNPLEID